MMLAQFFGLVFLSVFSLVQATLYVNQPTADSTCYGGQTCTVTWLDDGEVPLLGAIGACYVGLYNGNGVLVQEIEPVNVASVHSLQFSPDSSAGPDASDYYLNFTSVTLMANQTTHYSQYSADFTLASMSGSLSSPVASDLSTLSVPSTVLSPATSSVPNSFSPVSSSPSLAPSAATGTVNSISSASSSTSRVSTSLANTSAASPTSSAPASSSTASSSAARSARIPAGALSAMLATGMFLFLIAHL